MLLLTPRQIVCCLPQNTPYHLTMPPPLPPPSFNNETSATQISLHAMEGHTSPKTISIIGTVQKTKLNVLIGGGSTHNLMQDRLVKFLGLHSVHSNQFKIMVGNSEQLSCNRMSSNIPLILSTISFVFDFYVLPINGTDLVLGLRYGWSTSLGPIVTYFLI